MSARMVEVVVEFLNECMVVDWRLGVWKCVLLLV